MVVGKQQLRGCSEVRQACAACHMHPGSRRGCRAGRITRLPSHLLRMPSAVAVCGLPLLLLL